MFIHSRTWKKFCMPVFETYDLGAFDRGSGKHRFKMGSLKIQLPQTHPQSH